MNYFYVLRRRIYDILWQKKIYWDILAIIIGLNIQLTIFDSQFQLFRIMARSDTFKTKSTSSIGFRPSLGSKRKSIDGAIAPGLRRGRPDGTNDKLFKPSARTSWRHSSWSAADLKLESRKRRIRAVNAKTSTSMPTVLEIPNRSAGKPFNVSKFLQFIEITVLLVVIILVCRLVI